MTTTICCAECEEEGVGSLKACKSCMMLVKYCSASCQRNHSPTHKAACKLRAAELRDAALFKDPPPKKDCPICFLPMPDNLIYCVTLPPATISYVPIQDFAIANQELASMAMEQYYSCCGFVEGAYIPSGSPETLRSVRFAMKELLAKRTKNYLKN